MNEYQITVSLNGKFLFRTEWDTDKLRVGSNAVALSTSMPFAKVSINSRSCIMTEMSIRDLLHASRQ